MKNNDSILVSPAEGRRILGVGRNAMYEDLLKRKDFPCMKIGKKHYINREMLQEWANKQCNKED